MRILICEPGKYPRVEDIPHTLEEMQKVVGGCIQAVYPWKAPAALICDDEGLLKGYAFNRMINDDLFICGTFFLCGIGEEDFTDLPEDLINRFEEEFFYPHMLVRTPAGITVIPMEEE